MLKNLANLSSPTNKNKESDISVGFIFLPQFSLIAFAGFVEVFRQVKEKEDLCCRLPCHWTVMGESLEPIISSSGIHILPWELFQDTKKFDYIIVLGGLLPKNIKAETELDNISFQGKQAIKEYLCLAAEKDVTLVGACTGSYVLAEAGLLNGRKCCVHWCCYNDFLTQFPNCVPVAGEIFIIDNKRITSPGGSSTIDLALYLVERHFGKEQSTKCLRHLLQDWPRSPDHPQVPFATDYSSISDPRIRKAIFLMEQHLNGSLSIDTVAEYLNLSKRQLERLFQKHFEKRPFTYYRSMRLKYGKWLLHNTDRSITEIAIDSGFSDSSHFTRWFKRLFGQPPHKLRSASK